jgi:hypothetical protein
VPQIERQTKVGGSKKPSGGVLDRIGDIQFAADSPMSLLVYGKSGTGKTTFWSTFPGPILCILSSGTIKTGELRSLNTPALRKKIKQVVLEHSSEMKELINYLKGGDHPFKTVVLDHVSGLQDQTLKEILGLEELPAQKYFGFAKREDYQVSTSQCKEYCRGLLDRQDEMNVVIVGQERTFGGKDDDEGQAADMDMIQIAIGVGVTPALAAWLQPACDYTVQAFKRGKYEVTETIVGEGKNQVVEKIRTRVRGVDFCIRTEHHDMIATKFRLPKGMPLPDVIVDPSYDKLIKVMKGEPVE